MKLVLFMSIAFLIFITTSTSAENSATEIIRETDNLLRGETSHALFEMTVITPNWTRTLKAEAWSSGKWEKAFIRILSPAKETGTGSLKIKNGMWNYLPRVERVIKIPPSMMLQGWMGSDFTNDDLVKASSLVDDYTHTILHAEKVKTDEVWVMELLPKPEAAVVWGKLLLWIRKGDFVPVKEEFYDERGKLVRVLNFREIENIGDRNYPMAWEMTSLHKKGHKTLIHYDYIKFNVSVSDGIFTLKNLQMAR